MSALIQQLFEQQNECSLSWIRANQTPASAVVSFVYFDNKLWMTALAHSRRVRAIERNAFVSVTISGKGCAVGHSRCVSIQGQCEIVEDQVCRDEFFQHFCQAVLPGSQKGASMMHGMMNNSDNAVLMVKPNKLIPYDAHDMLEAANNA
jgi:general stress protein 26